MRALVKITWLIPDGPDYQGESSIAESLVSGRNPTFGARLFDNRLPERYEKLKHYMDLGHFLTTQQPEDSYVYKGIVDGKHEWEVTFVWENKESLIEFETWKEENNANIVYHSNYEVIDLP
jgi:hypothetical protein